jgi:hypothetical protein
MAPAAAHVHDSPPQPRRLLLIAASHQLFVKNYYTAIVIGA